MAVPNALQRLVVVLQGIGRDISTESRREASDVVGVRVLSWIWQAYSDKARGGSDVWGMRWRPIKPASLRSRFAKLKSFSRADRATQARTLAEAAQRHEIGVDTGRLIRSLQYGASEAIIEVDDVGVEVGSAVLYAGYFDAARPIIPDGLTPEQEDELSQIVGRAYERDIQRALDREGFR